MSKLEITLERKVNNRIHRTILRGSVHLHVELMDKLIDRCTKRIPNINIEDLFEQITEKH